VRIFDVFPIANELDVLEVRLETLKNAVDAFVVYEWSTDYRGNPKPMYLRERLEEFSSRFPNLIYVPFDKEVTQPGFEGERIQRDTVKRVLNDLCQAGDSIIYSDIDEIPRPEAVSVASNMIRRGVPIVHFAQDFFMYYFNLREVTGTLQSFTGEYPRMDQPKWLGSRMLPLRTLRDVTMSELRYPQFKEHGKRVADGGWHFSWVGSEKPRPAVDRTLEKVRHYHSHLEQLNFAIEFRVRWRVKRRKDVWGRPGVRFEVAPLADLPEYVVRNAHKFSYALLPT